MLKKSMGYSQSISQKEIQSITSLPQETRKSSNKQSKLTRINQKLEKRKIKLKVRMKENIRIRAETNELQSKKQIEKINKLKR